MSSFTNLLIAVVAIQFVLILCNVPNVPGTALYTFLTNPSDWDSAGWNLLFTDAITAIGAVSMFVGLYVYKSDFIVFASSVLVLYGFGKPLVNLWTLIAAHSDPIVSFLLVSPIIILYITTLISWWRGRTSD